MVALFCYLAPTLQNNISPFYNKIYAKIDLFITKRITSQGFNVFQTRLFQYRYTKYIYSC